jgi:enterochelin esterase family protein
MSALTRLTMVAVLAAQAAPPAARLEHRVYPSTLFGGTRPVWTYAPPPNPRGEPPAGLIVCLWGNDYVDQIQATATLDALWRDGRIPRLAVIFLDDKDDRFQNILTTRQVGDSIATELIPWARVTLGVAADARHTLIVGYSAAGLAATHAAFTHPDVFGNVFAQSGAFWRAFEGDGASDLEWLAMQYEAVPPRRTRFYLEVGGGETRPAGGTAVSIKAANEHLRDVLRKKGYDVAYREIPGAQHEYTHWRDAFGDGLVALTKDWR